MLNLNPFITCDTKDSEDLEEEDEEDKLAGLSAGQVDSSDDGKLAQSAFFFLAHSILTLIRR